MMPLSTRLSRRQIPIQLGLPRNRQHLGGQGAQEMEGDAPIGTRPLLKHAIPPRNALLSALPPFQHVLHRSREGGNSTAQARSSNNAEDARNCAIALI